MDWKEYSVNMERVAYTYNQFKILSLFYVKGKLKRHPYTVKKIFTDGLEVIESISLLECVLVYLRTLSHLYDVSSEHSKCVTQFT